MNHLAAAASRPMGHGGFRHGRVPWKFRGRVEAGSREPAGASKRGDEVERVWAAWALGLRFGAQIVPELRDALRRCPFRGTQRHFIVVLAGLGERLFLYNLAMKDPDPFVRTTACRYLVRVAWPDNDIARRVLHDRLFNDPSPDVRVSILQEGGDILTSLGPVQRDRLLSDADHDIRRQAHLLF